MQTTFHTHTSLKHESTQKESVKSEDTKRGKMRFNYRDNARSARPKREIGANAARETRGS